MEKTKPVHQLDTPFSTAQWPSISQDDQDSILDLLCNFLSPIGQHRRTFLKPSKGRRSRAKKRKRDQVDGKSEDDVAAPPPPTVASCVDVGLSTITRTLQQPGDYQTSAKHGDEESRSSKQSDVYTLVFVVRSGPPSAFHSHLPQMVAVASKASALTEPIRLVGFSKSCEERLSTCMGIPRVTSVAIKQGDVAQLKALADFVQKRVSPICVPWLEEAGQANFRETRIKTMQAPIGKKRQKKT